MIRNSSLVLFYSILILLLTACQEKRGDNKTSQIVVDLAQIDQLKSQIDHYKNEQVVRDWMVLIDIAQVVRKTRNDFGEKELNSKKHGEAASAYNTLKNADGEITTWAGDYDVNVLQQGSKPTVEYLNQKLVELRSIDKTIDIAVQEGKKFLNQNDIKIPDTFKAPVIDKNKKPDFTVTVKKQE